MTKYNVTINGTSKAMTEKALYKKMISKSINYGHISTMKAIEEVNNTGKFYAFVDRMSDTIEIMITKA